MAAFASCRRSGWVRFLVVLLCALFVFATLGAPAARAEALTVGLFTAAAVLSAATAALGFKLSNSAEGQATLAKMVQDFKVTATAVGLVLVGSKINGLIDGVDYIKMQVKAGKTYLDSRVFAWVQQWLAKNAVYDTVIQGSYIGNTVEFPFEVNPCGFDAFYSGLVSLGYSKDYLSNLVVLVDHYNLSNFFSSTYVKVFMSSDSIEIDVDSSFPLDFVATSGTSSAGIRYFYPPSGYTNKYTYYKYTYGDLTSFKTGSGSRWSNYITLGYYKPMIDVQAIYGNFSFAVQESSNNTGLSGTDTLGKDVIDLTLDQILEHLKEWAPDWWDAGADSSTNGAAAGAKDLPLNMGSDVKTVTGNPALEVDQPLIYTPWFEQDVGQLRNGETAGTVTNTATSAADTADKAEAAQGTVEDAQGVVQSLISWGLDYISPDKGLFSRFPLCIPYDAYLLVTAALGVDAQDIGDIVGQSPGDLSAQVDDGVAVQSDFVPVVSIKHDWTQDGVTTPLELTIDLRPYDDAIKMIRTLVSVYVIAELIASEYKRIRGS